MDDISLRRRDDISLRRRDDTSLRRRDDTSLRRRGDISLRRRDVDQNGHDILFDTGLLFCVGQQRQRTPPIVSVQLIQVFALMSHNA